MKGKLTEPAAVAVVVSVVLLGTLAGCVAESADEEDSATPLDMVLSVQPDVPNKALPGAQSEPAKSGSSVPATKPPQTSFPSDQSDSPGADPEPSPWVPGDMPQEVHTK
jgi:hypothetical protein